MEHSKGCEKLLAMAKGMGVDQMFKVKWKGNNPPDKPLAHLKSCEQLVYKSSVRNRPSFVGNEEKPAVPRSQVHRRRNNERERSNPSKDSDTCVRLDGPDYNT